MISDRTTFKEENKSFRGEKNAYLLPNSTMWVILSRPSEHEYSPASEGRASDKTSSDPAKKDI